MWAFFWSLVGIIAVGLALVAIHDAIFGPPEVKR